VINHSIARRYAKALLGLVDSDLIKTAEKLKLFADLVESNPALANVLKNPGFSLDERKKVLDRVLSKLGWQVPLTRFLYLLVKRHRVAFLCAIADSFLKYVDEQEGRVRVSIESAVALDPKSLVKLQKEISKGLGKEVVFEQTVEPDLIAGMAVKVGSLVVDGSMKSQLARLREQLVRSRA
jgi:F-type H+-transporting ATPase subunit delta